MNISWKVLIGDGLLVGLVTFALAEDKPVKIAAPKGSDSQISVHQTKPSSSADFPVIGYIEKRDRTITIRSGPKGTLYSVKSADGKVLFENLSADQLRAKAPELGELIKTAVAGDARIRVTMDASERSTPNSVRAAPKFPASARSGDARVQ